MNIGILKIIQHIGVVLFLFGCVTAPFCVFFLPEVNWQLIGALSVLPIIGLALYFITGFSMIASDSDKETKRGE